jgi:hypothetical protein
MFRLTAAKRGVKRASLAPPGETWVEEGSARGLLDANSGAKTLICQVDGCVWRSGRSDCRAKDGNHLAPGNRPARCSLPRSPGS